MYPLQLVFCLVPCLSFSVGAQPNDGKAHLAWFHDAYSLWDFDSVVNNTVLDFKSKRTSQVVGNHHVVPGPNDGALELSGASSYVILGDFRNTCLPNPHNCEEGFTICFWVNLRKVLQDGVILQLGLSRRSQGITVNTGFKNYEAFLAFYVNTPTTIHYLKTKLPHDVWHHVGIVWNATAKQKLSVFVNCSAIRDYERLEESDFWKGADRMLVLGANHARKKSTPIAVDDLAIWFKSIEQKRMCEIMNYEKVHGNYSSWSKFSSCSSSCGSGIKTRKRLCTNPSPAYGGRDCSSLGPSYNEEPCNEKPCPIAGGYTQWSVFSRCPSSCGRGKRFRTRNCSNPMPQYGGDDCSSLGEPIDIQDCNINPCPVHGNYSSWTSFSRCTTSCGVGIQVRNRSCTEPKPQFGGRNCSTLGLPYESRKCNLGACAVHGGYSEWSRFSVCSKSCGNATKVRKRTCTNPEPRHKDNNCSALGPSIDTVQCDNTPCPVHGNYSEWSSFTPCGKTCGNGTKRRTRTCTNPSPSHGGNNCSALGPLVQVVSCDVSPCPVNGNYSEWSLFSACSKTCGKGSQTRIRTCTNPIPLHSGKNCTTLGPSTETRQCFLRHCAVHGNYTQWSPFSSCSETCGPGTRSRHRLCSNPKPQFGGDDCSKLGPSSELVSCNARPCPVHGNYSSWTSFSRCSVSCGVGIQVRNRSCTEPKPQFGGRNCSILGFSYESRECNLGACPVHGGYSEWSAFSVCSKSCGNSTKTRKRTCTNPEPKDGGHNCSAVGPSIDTAPCYNTPCPVHGNYSGWSSFTSCDKTCGNGSKIRRRSCNNPEPRFGGRNCSELGPETVKVSCNKPPCPVHGNFAEWSGFSDCSSTCGNSTKRRTRTCTNPSPSHGGNDCSALGPLVQIVLCEVNPCPTNGNYSEWSLFTVCSKTCGKGSQTRSRTCSNPAPLLSGNDCKTLGPSTETRQCFLRHCPIHGNYTQWSPFSSCSETCGPGTKNRRRLCSNPNPRYGGDDCSKLGPESEIVACNSGQCPVHGNYSEWSPFESCSKSCENGTQVRRRYCNSPSPRHGGRNCSALGPSVETRWCEVQTCPDIGFSVKFQLNDMKWNAELEDNTSQRHQNLSSELKTAIKALHEDKEIKEVKILEFSNGSVVATVDVVYVARYYQGVEELYDAFYTDKRIGSHDVTPITFTSTDVPIGYPQNLTVFNRSSTSLGLRWSPVPERLANGLIWGYAVTYKKLSAGKGETKKIYRKLFTNASTGNLYHLKKYSWYNLRITAMNRKGSGIPSAALVVLTDEDVPNPSSNLKPIGHNTSSTSLKISWKAIAKEDINGILRGYRVFYKTFMGVLQVRTVSSNTLFVTLSGLQKYKAYEIQIAGLTSKGVGGKSNKTIIYTDEDVPDAAPKFHSCLNESSTAILLHWYEIPKDKRNGVILGYRVYYRETAFPGRTWGEIKNISANQTTQDVRNLKEFTKYSFQISAYTRKGEGVLSRNISVSTDEDVPCAMPSEVSAINVSSTSLWVEWRSLSVACIRGILKGYVVLYKEQSNTIQAYQRIVVPPTNTELNITELRKFTVYNISVAGYTSKGLGPFSIPIMVSTAEDVPSKSPLSIRAFNRSSTSIILVWKRIPDAFIHGILRGYHIHLKKANETKLEKIFRLSPDDRSLEISGLLKYTEYAVRIMGFTSVGVGVVSTVTVSTDEDVPSRAPREFEATNKTTPVSIPLTWKPINDPFYIHGVLLGYKIEVELTRLAGEPLQYARSRRTTHIVGPKTLTCVLKDLEIYATYTIKIRAFTRIGDGPSIEISAETCNCRSSFSTNWWINPPYIYKNSSEASGIFPAVLPHMVSFCCGYCQEYHSTATRFENDGKPSLSFLKSGISDVRNHIDDNVELHFPMYGQIYQVKYYGRYEFIPLVESPGVVFLVREDEAGKATMLLLQTLWKTFPVLILIMLLVWLFALVVWFADNFSNPDQFPPSFGPGFFEGIWWSFITMTAVGYGDRFPRSFPARLLGILWILIGAILVAIYTSIVTANITNKIITTEVKLYGTKVAMIYNSSEYRLAVRKNGKLHEEHPYNNLNDVYDALAKRRVQGALVDAYVLGSKRDLFNNLGVRVNKIYDYSSAYGVVLAGEAKKLQKCFREYINENRKGIFEIIEKNVDTIEEDQQSQSVKRAKSLMDPSFIVYKKCLAITVILLFVAAVLGILFELIRKPLQRWLNGSKQTCDVVKVRNHKGNIQKLLQEWQREFQKWQQELTRKLTKLRRKHHRELKQWVKLKKSIRRRVSEDTFIFSSSCVRYDESYMSPSLQLRRLIQSYRSPETSFRGNMTRETFV